MAKDYTLELRLPDEIYDKAAELDEETLKSILQSVLGGQARFGIKRVVVTRKSESKVAKLKAKAFGKPC